MSRVQLDPEHLTALAGDLRRYRGRVDDLLAQARALDAGADVAGLAGAPAWAGRTASDLDGRVALLRLTDRTVLDGLDRLGLRPRDLAGSARPIATTLSDVALALQLEPVGPTSRARRPNEALDDWALRVLGDEVERYSRLPLAPLVTTALDWYGTYGDLLASWAATTTAVSKLAKWSLSPTLVRMLEAQWVKDAVPGMAYDWVLGKARGFGALTAPGFAPAWWIREGMTWLEPWEYLQNPTLARLARYTGNVFGRPWIDPRLPLDVATGVGKVGRGASNLVTVARNPLPGLSRTASVARTAGLLRGLGVVGGVASTAFDVANVAAQGNPVEALKREGAGYVADLAKTGFDASLTAAIVAPNPVTWGAVAVTGTVWAGAEVVDRWDDVTAAADTAADWAGDALGGAADAVGGAVSSGLDTVKDSPVNPGNWF